MRVLFTFAGGSGHADPLVPIAHAAEAAGHTVAFSGRRSAGALLEAHGFSLFGDPERPASDPPTITPLLDVDMEREYRVLREGYAGRIARERLTRVLGVCGEWRPDVIVCDEVDFGGMLGAEQIGIPHATVLVIAAGSFVRPDVVAEPLDALRAERGLPPDPRFAMPSRHLVLSPTPPSFRDPAHPLPPRALSLRPSVVGSSGTAVATPWLADLADTPTVYLTLGTVFNMESGDLFARVLSGLHELPVSVVVTVGPRLDPGSFGPQPETVHIERYIAQSDLLPHCDLVINHGGSGSVIGALAHGLPMVVLPMGADQPLNPAGASSSASGSRSTPSGPHRDPSGRPWPPSWMTRATVAPPNGSGTRSPPFPGRMRPCPSSSGSRTANARRRREVRVHPHGRMPR